MNTDRLAAWYRWIEYLAFGRALERRRFVFLDRLAGARRVLIIGEGDGRALERLLTLAPKAEIEVVESSGEMIALARGRMANSNRVRFRQQDALTISWPREHYDGIITFFLLDCFNQSEARSLIGCIASSMLPGAIWLVSDFAIPDQGWRRWHAKAWIWTMYRFFAVATGLRTRTLPPIQRLLAESGMHRLELEEERGGLMRSEVWGNATISSPDKMAP